MNLMIQYPFGFILLCLMVGALYAFALYFRDQRFAEQTRRLNPVLAFLRGTAVSFICFLLLEPIIKTVELEKKEPIVIFAQDNSESIRTQMDSSEMASYLLAVEQLKKSLSERYQLKSYTFGEEVKKESTYSFSEQATQISSLFEEISDLYSNQNLGAIILATDGIYNQGASPLYLATQMNVPVFTIGLGDTSQKKDLVLKKVYNNQIAYLGDQFSIQVDLAAYNCKNSNTQLQILNQGKVVHSQNILINDIDYFSNIEIVLNADAIGVQKYELRLSQIQGERTLVNNNKTFYVEILDARQKLLILAESPHPDLAALKRAISGNKNFEIELTYPDQLRQKLSDYDVLILHQLPSKKNPVKDILNQAEQNKMPLWFIVGTQTDLTNFNQVQNILQIKGFSSQYNEVAAVLNSNYRSFTLENRWSDPIVKFPPLTAPFGNYKARVDAEVLMYQKIGSVITEDPLWVSLDDNSTKKSVLAAEGFWKWRINDYMNRENFNVFDEICNKTVQYLSNKEDKRKFRAFPANTLFYENERISFDAELYNDNFERINEADAELEIKGEKGKKYNFTFSKTAQAYRLDVGRLEPGTYSFTAKTKYKGKELKSSGQFSIQALQLEVFEQRADHNVLKLISDRSGANFLYPNQMNQLLEWIDKKGYAKTVLYDSVRTYSLIHLKWIFFLIFALLTGEWFLRRYFGGY